MPTIEPPAGAAAEGLLIVWAYDSFHFSGEAEKYEVGRFASCEEALDACRTVVDEFLESTYEEGMSAEDLRAEYAASGPDPHLEPHDAECIFEALSYVEERSAAITGSG